MAKRRNFLERARAAGVLAMAAAAWWACPAAGAGPRGGPASRPAEAGGGQGRVQVAVFNFQMKAGGPSWGWLEKGLADRMITDLFQEPSVAVVQRDRMQEVAESLRWAPEMMGDPDTLGQIGKSLKPTHVVSGVFEVQGGQLAVTAIVVDLQTQQAVFRREVKGPSADALELARKISAAVVGWLTKRPEGAVLEALPVWTASVPAARAMYEGIGLYDQGRYGEAWLRFRQAHRADGRYAEAGYWVGKMYYFMDRYEHARRALEEFLHVNRRHPRTGDAVKEYLHTFEKVSDTPPETLLAMYEEIARRYPAARIHDAMAFDQNIEVMDFGSFFRNEFWLKAKTARLLEQTGRPAEAVKAAQAAAGRLTYGVDWWGRFASFNPMAADRIAMRNRYRNYFLTGQWLPEPRGGIDGYATSSARELTLRAGEPVRVMTNQRYRFRTPEGQMFKSLTARAPSAREGWLVKLLVWHGAVGDIPTGQPHKASAAREGARYADLPRTGMLEGVVAEFPDDPNDPSAAGPVRSTPATLTAELEPIPETRGALEVRCGQTEDFRVRVDGRYARRHEGLVGFLVPGEHEVELTGGAAGAPYGSWKTKVQVHSGRVTPVAGQLPFRAGSPWAAWTAGAIPPPQAGWDSDLRPYADAPALQADEKAIRMVWSRGDDLWATVSTDGRTFGVPRRVGLPVSSGWIEWNPRLLRDESGRFLLTFESDRTARHELRPYVCWSRDFEHWSAPVMLMDARARWSDMIQDDRGRYLWAYVWINKVELMASSDGYRWERLGAVSFPSFCRGVQILQRSDGRYELLVPVLEYDGDPTGDKWIDSYDVQIHRLTSPDARVWTRGAVWTYPSGVTFSGVHAEGRTVLGAFSGAGLPWRGSLRLYECEGAGKWPSSPEYPGLGQADGCLAWHRRWGYMVCWRSPDSWRHSRPASGPFFLRGPSLEPLFKGETLDGAVREAIALEMGAHYPAESSVTFHATTVSWLWTPPKDPHE